MNNKVLNISLDFDSTLSRLDVQKFAIELKNKGIITWIVTSRQSTKIALEKGHHWVEKQNEELFKIAEKCEIPKERIIFTEHAPKIEFLKDKNFLFHLDDDIDELLDIKISKDSCAPINVNYFEWKEICEKLINDTLKNK
jgi:hypothetical protein